MKLHLGCGERYLDGYINIDFPVDNHTVQAKSVADQTANIFDLRYKKSEVDEIRLHHVFEHFSRSVVCAFLSAWNFWLKDDGLVHIEVPDFKRTARAALGLFNSRNKRAVAERHIFGSQEVFWANHLAGYTKKNLSYLLKQYGFKVVKVEKNSWQGTYNLEIIARKNKSFKTREKLLTITKKYLSLFLLDDSETEKKLLEVWLNDYNKQLDKNFPYES